MKRQPNNNKNKAVKIFMSHCEPYHSCTSGCYAFLAIVRDKRTRWQQRRRGNKGKGDGNYHEKMCSFREFFLYELFFLRPTALWQPGSQKSHLVGVMFKLDFPDARGQTNRENKRKKKKKSRTLKSTRIPGITRRCSTECKNKKP